MNIDKRLEELVAEHNTVLNSLSKLSEMYQRYNTRRVEVEALIKEYKSLKDEQEEK